MSVSSCVRGEKSVEFVDDELEFNDDDELVVELVDKNWSLVCNKGAKIS